jgi:hypothetical protein
MRKFPVFLLIQAPYRIRDVAHGQLETAQLQLGLGRKVVDDRVKVSEVFH